MTGWGLLIALDQDCCFMSKERQGRTSRSELERWLQNGAVLVNGARLDWDEDIDFEIHSCVLFPKSPHRTTLR